MGVSAPSGEPLVGAVVRLDPFTDDDADELASLLLDPLLYESGFIMYPVPATLDEARARVWSQWVSRRTGTAWERVSYAIRLVADSELGSAGTLVGTSSLGDFEPDNEALHLGWTIYGRRWWGTTVNVETKYLLLREAFERLGFGRVRIQTDAANRRSRAAIAKLGATEEGTLRRHKRRADGTFRDTVVFSILGEGWADVKAGLEARLARPADLGAVSG